MNVLNLNDNDVIGDSDYLTVSAADIFVSGGFDHIESEGEVHEAEVIGQYPCGAPMVFIKDFVGVLFEIGKYYKHNGGGCLHVLCRSDTTMWGKNALIAESSGHVSGLQCVGSDGDAGVNWKEVSKKEWMTNFS